MSQPEFYRDYGIASVERLSRAIVVAQGGDPDGEGPETGRANAPLIPAWWKEQEHALRFIACMGALIDKPEPAR